MVARVLVSSLVVCNDNDSDASVGTLAVGGASDAESIGLSQILPADSYEEKILMEYSIGIVEVHLENLIAPHPSRATRVLDHEHVGILTDSFADNSCGQVVIFQGMLTDAMVAHSTLYQEGLGKVEVLGGNHSREALQTLYRKGTLAYSTVKCNLFRPLPRILALKIGYAHNTVLHEKKKPVSFMDKTRLFRECRPSDEMSKVDTVKWKDSLVTVLGVKDRRRLTQSFGVHLAMANLQPELWAKVCFASEKHVMSERFMRGFIRLEDSDKFSCMETLMSKGATAFKQNVKSLLDAEVVNGKKNEKKRKADESLNEIMENVAPNNGTDDTQEEETLIEDQSRWKQKYEELMEQYEQLERENLLLKNEVEEMKRNKEIEKMKGNNEVGESKEEEKIEMAVKENKRRRCSTNAFTKGESVMAFWRDECTGLESWQEATVKFTYSDGRCRVQWKSDGMMSTPRLHEVQKLN